MKNSIIITFAALVVACGAAVAAPGNNGGGEGGCGVGQQTNGCGGTGAVNNGGAGGAGGSGGHGGTGIGIGQGGNATGGQGGVGIGGNATGGSVLGSGNSSSSSGVIGSGNSANTNTLGQQQGQAQGQLQGQQQGQVATGGSSSSTSGASSNSGGNTFTTGATTQTVTSGPVSQSNAGNNTQTSVTVHGDTVTYEAQKRNPVSTAYSGPLAASNGTCLGSASGGLQTVAVGMSFGTTTLDAGCDARYDAIALTQLGEHAAARARLCLKPEIAQAFDSAGTPCPGAKKAAAVSAQVQTASAGSSSSDAAVQYRDPIIRKRLGLPPLN